MQKKWDKRTSSALVHQFDVILKGDSRIEGYRQDTMFRGDPDAVIRARDEQDVREAMRFCYAEQIPMTFCGSQTSMTGASVATEGILISTERLLGIVDIAQHDRGGTVTTRSGTIVADLQRAVEDQGLFYPVAPTSRDTCRIGANVATNATGEDSFKYGPVRAYVRRLKIFLADGTERILERDRNETVSWERNRAGFFLGWKNPIDLLIGSEGTLAFVSQVTLNLIPDVPRFFSALAPFPDTQSALAFIVQLVTERTLTPRALELIDSGALRIMRTHPQFPAWGDEAQALVYFKQEYTSEAEFESLLLQWYERIKTASTDELSEQILVGQTEKEQETIRLMRHHIPQTINEEARKYWDAGGGKVGSDWWVPIPRLMEMMQFFNQLALATKLPFMAYAHVGSGHPHTNILARNAGEKELAEAVLLKCCRKAVALGGGVAGEHGVGKIHRNLVPIQHPGKAILQMRRWKEEYDPHYLLGRGNIFE